MATAQPGGPMSRREDQRWPSIGFLRYAYSHVTGVSILPKWANVKAGYDSGRTCHTLSMKRIEKEYQKKE